MNIVYLLYALMLLPAYSLSQVLVGVYFQNRIVWLPIGGIYYLKHGLYRFPRILLPLYILIGLFASYVVFSVLLGWNAMLYLGYLLTFLLIVISAPMMMSNKSLFVDFCKTFLIANALFSLFQVVCVNFGMDKFSMLQSNVPAQKEASYVIPFFLTPPFIRYPGLFNESSPFIAFLTISFVFFKLLGDKYKTYKRLSFLLILLGGAKIGYVFIVLYGVFFTKSKLIKIIALVLTITITYLVIVNFDLILEFTHGEAQSLLARSAGFQDALDSEYTAFGAGIQTSSDGEVGLDMFSILLGGFGVIGSSLILGCLFWFYKGINFCRKNMFVLPFILCALSSGSLLVIHYSMIIYCLTFFHNSGDSNIEKNHNIGSKINLRIICD